VKTPHFLHPVVFTVIGVVVQLHSVFNVRDFAFGFVGFSARVIYVNFCDAMKSVHDDAGRRILDVPTTLEISIAWEYPS